MNQTKLNRIKSALRESIEIASKATKGPWDAFQRDGEIGSNYFRITFSDRNSDSLHGYCGEANAKFLSHARTMTPLACKALLTAIEGLELIDEQSPLGEYSAWDTLESITSEWPDA